MEGDATALPLVTYHRPLNALLRVWERGVRALPQIQIATRDRRRRVRYMW